MKYSIVHNEHLPSVLAWQHRADGTRQLHIAVSFSSDGETWTMKKPFKKLLRNCEPDAIFLRSQIRAVIDNEIRLLEYNT